MADAIEEASGLAINIAFSLATFRSDYPFLFSELVDPIVKDGEELLALLKNATVAGELSLANPYPVEVAGRYFESYAVAIGFIAASRDEDLMGKIDGSIWLQCGKEYERATGKACNAAEYASKRTRKAAPACKLCGGPTRVGSTKGRIRYIYCKDEGCGHSFTEVVR